MKANRRIMGIAGIILVSVATMAQSSPVWIYGATVKEVYSSGGNSFVVTLSSSPASCTNASSPDKYFYVDPAATPLGYVLTQSGVENLLGIAISSLTVGNTVDVLFDSATSYCYVAAIILHKLN